jgi:hypothetical protein
MRISRRAAVVLLAMAALAGSALSAGTAFGTEIPMLRTTLVGSVPKDPRLHGVPAGGAPWTIKRGVVKLHADGELTVLIQGLIIPELGNPGPVTSVDASIFCARQRKPFFTSPTVPLSKKGGAFIDAEVSLPSRCLDPMVLINPNGITSVYIAASGFGG